MKIFAPNTALSTGGLIGKSITALSAAMSGASTTIDMNVPSGVKVIGVQLRVDTLITANTGVSWKAKYTGLASQSICAAQPFTKNTKVNTFFTCSTDSPVTTGVTDCDIILEPDAGTFTAGVVTAVIYYQELTAMIDS